MKQGKVKQLRDFIRSHEMRYFVESDYIGRTYIKKAFKLEIHGDVHWVYFYGNRPELKDESILLKTMEEAKAEARKWRERKKEETAQYKARMDDVAKFLNEFLWTDYIDWKNNSMEVLPDGQPLADAIKSVYGAMPSKEKDDERTYINLLENYIKNGVIYTQAISFRPEQVVCVKYGEEKAVKIELTNGTTIIPKSKSVARLIKVIFGAELDSWKFTGVEEPAGKRDEVKKA